LSREIPYFSFGTYYTKYATSPGPNADEMRNLAYWAKGKWSGANVTLQHPWFFDGQAQHVGSTAEACQYVATLIENNIEDVREYLGIPDDGAIEWVPVPSSQLIASNINTERCCGREIGRLLAQAGLGTCSILVVNREPMPSKLDGNREPDYEDYLNNYVRVADPDSGSYQIYLDDIVTRGKHVAAMNVVLGQPDGASLLTIGRTDKATRDAYEVRSGQIKVSTLFGRLFVDVT
jgi:hypothetical protein